MRFAYWDMTMGSQFGNLTENGTVRVRYEGRYKVEAQVIFHCLLFISDCLMWPRT